MKINSSKMGNNFLNFKMKILDFISKFRLWILLCFLILLFTWFFYLRNAREERLMKRGDALLKKIEDYKVEHKRLPNSLEEIGMEERDGVDELYYTKRDSLHYNVSFGTSLGESKFYYSDSKRWEDRYREINQTH